MAVDISKPLKKFLPYLLKAQEENINEANTVLHLVKFFEQVLGYDAMEEITGEKEIKDKYVDLAIKLDGVIRLLIEAKAAGIDLKDKYIEQAQHYAATGNIPWVLLTNATQWKLYHLTFDKGIEYEHVFVVDLASEESLKNAAELLGLLHRRSIRKGDHEEYWRTATALRPESIARALFAEDALRLIRRKIKKRHGKSVDEEDLANAIHQMFSTEARKRIGPMKIYKTQKTAKPTKPKEGEISPGASPTPATSSVPPPEGPQVSAPAPEVTAGNEKAGTGGSR